MIDLLDSIAKKEKRVAIGLMSGTSMDGIDACLLEISGKGLDIRFQILKFITVKYTSEEKSRIEGLCNNDRATVKEICHMNKLLGEKFGDAAMKVCSAAGFSLEQVDFISSHGQTIYHMPEVGSTLQIGELAEIAAKTNCITVGDFRPSDMAYGGQGAPLVPFMDYVLFSHKEKGRILLNLGGIGNITVLPANSKIADVLAFDTGPANVLIDSLVQKITNGDKLFDESGSMAMKGQINHDWLNELIHKDKYLDLEPPKSTGREYYTDEFASNLYKKGIELGLKDIDIVSTITAYTAKTVANQINKFVLPRFSIEEIYVSGGGAHNKFIMGLLNEYLEMKVSTVEELGLSSDAKEAVAFAILGNQFLLGETNNIPSATGANRDVIMGKLVFPSKEI
ncbi:MAG: anhydro-N-acetylmuramic acid kinase [Tissierellaceae bacterium]|nr:anhydro-N-acetylmuramic acid kinase [Tissierellaceae bacterium]